MYGTLKLRDILPEVRKTGAEWIDLWPLKHGDQREQIDQLGHDHFAEMLRRHGVKLGVITRFDLGPFALQDEMTVLRKLGGTMLVTGSRHGKQPEGEELKQAVRRFADDMKPHAAAAESQGVTIAIENHGNALLCSPDSLRWFAEMASSPNLGVALAPYHLPQDPQLLARLIEDLGPKLALFYAWQHGHGCMTKLPKDEELLQMPGRGPLDFTPLLAALKKIGFQGLTEIFMHPVPRGIPILDTIEQVTAEINRARSYLDGCIEKV
jgi:sugar phosphate isomerase/epimerase